MTDVIPRRTVMVIFIALLAAMFLSSLDQSIVSTALPTIVGELGAVKYEDHDRLHPHHCGLDADLRQTW